MTDATSRDERPEDESEGEADRDDERPHFLDDGPDTGERSPAPDFG